MGDGGEYLPCYVVVRHVYVETSSMLANGLDELNKEFSFRGELETDYQLAHVFLVIVMHPDIGDQTLFLYEVGDLTPRKPRPIQVRVPMVGSNRPGKYEFYLFSGGCELFQTMMPIGAAEAELNRMVHERVKDLRDAPRPSPSSDRRRNTPRPCINRVSTEAPPSRLRLCPTAPSTMRP